ncbi:helix-turn-helix domain-containing protein [Shinella sp. CPCC 101442]|uniref:helix-turn-helix domain-containing protein n=1 Tax=Shinella sp. CPCC 101442 TaxID=2932265 RepID=UPI00215376E4|nr:helix-turn-helix transcriptional regulator [Shinella sp. CPCC 101442]MCR6502796.1 helix-turn-helix domain-containing protein [Shinella sp. CPCC 101442]
MTGNLEIHHLIRTARTAQRMSLRTLAAITGLTPSFLSQFERGKCGANETTIARISNGLDLSYSGLGIGRKLQNRIVHNKENCGFHLVGHTYSVSIDQFSGGRPRVDMIAMRSGERTLLGGKGAAATIRYLIVTHGRITLLYDNQCLTLSVGDTFESFNGHQIEVSSGDQQEVRLICISSPSAYAG